VLVYIEFKSRKPHADLEYFHKIARVNYGGWATENPDDVLLLNLGRTWRVGPEPEYVIVYWSPESGLERLGEWERIFKSGAADHLEAGSRVAGRIDKAGCYLPLRTPTRGADGPYYAEYFDIRDGSSRDDVARWYEERLQRHGDAELHLLVDRIGVLGPDPRGLAVWEIEDYGKLHGLAVDVESDTGPVDIVQGALYANCGDEVL
jgi:hypothetical protein